MKKVLLALVVLLTACSTTVPVARKFPDVPAEMNQRCADLKLIGDTNKLSDVVDTVTTNYGLYMECRVKADSWIDWYKEQKEIFESVK